MSWLMSPCKPSGKPMDDDSITTQLLPPAAGDEGRPDIENNAVDQSHLRRRRMPVRHMAMVGAEISNIESLDYEINENPMFKQDWRTGTKTEVFAYVCYKWLLAFLVGLLTGLVAVVINLAVENIAGYKFLLASRFIEDKRYVMGFIILAGINFSLTLIAACLCAFFSPAAAGPGIPEIKAYLNGIDTPNMYGFTTLLVKFLGTIAAVPASLDLGKEGPLVHIATCIAMAHHPEFVPLFGPQWAASFSQLRKWLHGGEALSYGGLSLARRLLWWCLGVLLSIAVLEEDVASLMVG